VELAAVVVAFAVLGTDGEAVEVVDGVEAALVETALIGMEFVGVAPVETLKGDATVEGSDEAAVAVTQDVGTGDGDRVAAGLGNGGEGEAVE